MEFKDISYILAVFDHKTISQAARSLYITQPALSQQIRKIENKLGKPLFTRSGHTMVPTAVCRMIVEYGRKLLSERDMMMYSAMHMQGNYEEKLRCGMSSFYTRHLLPPIVHYFQKNHPEVLLEVQYKGESSVLEQHVIEGKLDCCLLPMHPANPSIEYVPIGKESIYLAVPRSHPLNNMASPDGTIDITLARNEMFILHNERDKISLLQDRLFAYAGFTPRAAHTVSGWDVALAFVNSGIGLSIISEFIIGDYHPDDALCYYRVKNIDLSRHFALAYRRGNIMTPAMKALHAFAKEEFARQQARWQLR